MYYCNADICSDEALNGSWLCKQCLNNQFGIPDQRLVLPVVLIQKILSFVWSWNRHEYFNSFKDFYWMHQFVSPSVYEVSTIFASEYYFKFKKSILFFLATRYGRSKGFWFNLDGGWYSGRNQIYNLLHNNCFDIVPLIPPVYLNTIPDCAWLRIGGSANSDSVMWWMYDFRPSVFRYAANLSSEFRWLISTCCKWKSERMCLRLLKDGYVATNQNYVLTHLRSFIEYDMPFHLFKMFWELQNVDAQHTFQQQHDCLFLLAIDRLRFEVLEFFTQLQNFPSFSNFYNVALKQLQNDSFRTWMMGNLFLTSACFSIEALYDLPSSIILEVVVHILKPLSEPQQAEILQESPLILKLVKTNNVMVLDIITNSYHVKTFGSPRECCVIFALMCKEWSLNDVLKYWRRNIVNPCITRFCLRTWLHATCDRLQIQSECSMHSFITMYSFITWLLDTFQPKDDTISFYQNVYPQSNMITPIFFQLVSSKHFSLAERLFHAAIDFDMLRNENRQFLVYESLEVLFWYDALRDCYDKKLRIRDIRTSHNLLLRIAHHKQDSRLKQWLWNFRDDYGCSLKKGDERDLQRGLEKKTIVNATTQKP